MSFLRYGNYYGPGWSAGRPSSSMTLAEYIVAVSTTPAIDDQIDRIAKYHDIGLTLAGLENSGISAQAINWTAASWFWQKGGWRGYFGATGLYLGSLTFAVELYVGSPQPATAAQIAALLALLQSAQADVVAGFAPPPPAPAQA
jgi:hypothetical protein